jgi:hypothetical protein
VTDHTKALLMGYELPMDRCPSDNETRVAFTIGLWCRGRGTKPTHLVNATHPLMGDFWCLEWEDGKHLWLQAWPHPQNQGQTLLVVASAPPDG